MDGSVTICFLDGGIKMDKVQVQKELLLRYYGVTFYDYRLCVSDRFLRRAFVEQLFRHSEVVRILRHAPGLCSFHLVSDNEHLPPMSSVLENKGAGLIALSYLWRKIIG